MQKVTFPLSIPAIQKPHRLTGAYPFTAPTVMPFTKYFWKNG